MKRTAWFWMHVVGILWLVLYFCFLIKMPFYVYMNHIHLPEDCTSLETNVIITDVDYGWHIEAERLIYSSLGEEAIEDYINENNKFSKKIGIRVGNFYELYEMECGNPISSEKYPYKEQDAENYISLRCISIDFYEIMFVLGIVFMAVLCWLTYRLDRYLYEKTGTKEMQNADNKRGENALQALIHLWKYGDT